MPGKSKYSAITDAELKMRVVDALNEASDADMPTLDWIKRRDIILSPYSNQKLSRILGSLVDIGLVQKGKSKSLGRMVYRLTSRMRADGYEVEDKVSFGVPQRAWNGVGWDIEDEGNYD